MPALSRSLSRFAALTLLAAPFIAGSAVPVFAQQQGPAAKPLSEAAQAAIKTCDEGAAIPLDPDAKAPALWDTEMLPADFDFTKLRALASACAEAAQAAPAEKRLQLESLRMQVLADVPGPGGSTERADLIPLLRPFAEAGSAEANYLLFVLLHRIAGSGLDKLVEVQAEALAALEAAAKAGHLQALGTLYDEYRDGPDYRRDIVKALAVARQVDALPQRAEPGRYEAEIHSFMHAAATQLVLLGDQFTPAEQSAAFAEVELQIKAGRPSAVGAYVAALRNGRGTAKDPAKARQFLQQRADGGDAYAIPALAEMMANGEGGPIDGKGAIALLRGDREKNIPDAGPTLATLLLDGRFVGRQPQEAIRALYRGYDLEASIRLVDLVIRYHPHLDYPQRLIEKLSDGAGVDEPGAALALARLKIFADAPFTDVAGARRLLQALVAKGDRDALYLLAATQYENLDSSFQPSRRQDGISDEALSALIADGFARKEAPAFLLKAKFQRRGVLYPQDDQAATANLINAANLGNVEAMVKLGEAYDDGLGIAKNPRERLHAWREAAKHGSLEARQKLASAFPFDSFDKLLTLREGITEPIALYNDGIGRTINVLGINGASIAFSGMFSGGRASDAGAPALAQAVMDAYRLAPAGLAEDALVKTLKAFPDEIRIEMEKILKQQGFYAGDPQGFFGPDARKALAAWVDAKGPLPDETTPAPATVPAQPTAADGVTTEIVDRVRDRAFRTAKAVKSKTERHAVIVALNALARHGDTASRWALVGNYHNADYVRNVVSPEEVTRYALDLMVRRPDGVEKPEFEFIFDVTEIAKDGKSDAFAGAVVSAIRDTPALQDPLALGSLLHQFVFAPDACDSLLKAAQKAGAEGLGSDGCDDATSAALLAFAKAKGPAGIEAAARSKAAAEILALDKAAK